jgi:hypothetical protein
MIIGAITETNQSAAPGGNAMNGTAIMQFYTMSAAVEWAQLQSTGTLVGSVTVFCLTTVINTATGERRWWYGGTEYTG